MKVTKRGTPPSERIWAGTCSNCKSEMEEFETKLENIQDRDIQRSGAMAHETCPVCNSKFWMYPRKVHKPVDDVRESNCRNPSYVPPGDRCFQPELYP